MKLLFKDIFIALIYALLITGSIITHDLMSKEIIPEFRYIEF